MFTDVDFPFYFYSLFTRLMLGSAHILTHAYMRAIVPCFSVILFFSNAHCQRHLNLQTLMNSAKWNQITTITIRGNNEVEINNKNQSIHLT